MCSVDLVIAGETRMSPGTRLLIEKGVCVSDWRKRVARLLYVQETVGAGVPVEVHEMSTVCSPRIKVTTAAW